MSKVFDQRLDALAAIAPQPCKDCVRGVEKESLRVSQDGRLAQTTHPEGLGSALTNSYITTDFSEALLEFVTPTFYSIDHALTRVNDLHQFVHSKLGDELLWASSMPCVIAGTDNIPLARYGTSNVGKMKTVYRRGLGYRYGRPMQTIAGVHYNFSVPATFWDTYGDVLGRDDNKLRSEHYLGLVRNFRRYGWIILYLFGASPAVCRSFAGDRKLDMPLMNGDTYYAPYATSLRMSDLGYNNKNQSRIRISLNDLDDYIRDLSAAIHTPEPDYEKIGVVVDGRYRQLNTNLLQIENEYYSAIRPKRVANSGERPTAALRRGGIEYIEVRSLDCNLYEPSGLCANTMRFIEAFLVYCLLENSPFVDDAALDEMSANQLTVARRGRDPDCELVNNGQPIRLRDWAAALIDNVDKATTVMDEPELAREAVAEMRQRVEDSSLTPSARVLAELQREGSSFFELAMQQSLAHARYYREQRSMDPDVSAILERESTESLRRQADIESADAISFEQYLEAYFAAD
ncbi:MAG: glutamate--cysteine ligase [Pseudomonadota bacterium]